MSKLARKIVPSKPYHLILEKRIVLEKGDTPFEVKKKQFGANELMSLRYS